MARTSGSKWRIKWFELPIKPILLDSALLSAHLPAARVENFEISEFWAKMAKKGVVKVPLDSY